jgi:hypothetical protein
MLNQLINIFWTIISFSALGWYWGEYFAEDRAEWLLYVFIVASVLAFNIPVKLISALNLSTNPRTYEWIGVRAMRWLVQDGMLVRRVNQRLGKNHKAIPNRQAALKYLNKIAMQERYHYCCFVFFSLSSVSAILTGKIGLALLMAISNIVYNVYPILLQQYNRLRIRKLISRLDTA